MRYYIYGLMMVGALGWAGAVDKEANALDSIRLSNTLAPPMDEGVLEAGGITYQGLIASARTNIACGLSDSNLHEELFELPDGVFDLYQDSDTPALSFGQAFSLVPTLGPMIGDNGAATEVQSCDLVDIMILG